ncbi:hypothetical protein [Achromobacter arsenitoxydans]|uniref:hypothetical protein n=1 Tax=Achromobacter arsenitoxydans TaxID=1147684 RepID=UPI001112ACA7|nr:hypothetical protein [Achromobacter arsenitoxydans]
MSIRSSLHASLYVALLAPTVASANGGVIRFVGAIVEPAACVPRVTQPGSGGHPQVACGIVPGERPTDTANRVKTDVRELASPADDKTPGATPRRYLVTVEYL